MKRRRFVQSIPFLYASPALFAQSLLAQGSAKIDTSTPESVGSPVPRFFTAPQMAALRRLSDIILPSIAGAPGALDAGAAEFLDFLVGQSLATTRTLYRTGLDTLNTQATAKYAKAFAALDQTQADAILSPLRQPWTWKEPADPFAAFLRHAKADILSATTNSREWITAAARNRGSSGNGTYWLLPE